VPMVAEMRFGMNVQRSGGSGLAEATDRSLAEADAGWDVRRGE